MLRDLQRPQHGLDQPSQLWAVSIGPLFYSFTGVEGGEFRLFGYVLANRMYR